MLIGGNLLLAVASAPLGAAALRDQLAAGVAGGWSPWAFDGGFGDVFVTNTLADSTGATFSAGTFSNPMGQAQAGNNNTTITKSFGNANKSFVDVSSTVPNGINIVSLSIYNVTNNADGVTLQIVVDNGNNTYTVVAETATKSINTSGWNVFPISYSVPSTGTYRLSYKKPNDTFISQTTSGQMNVCLSSGVGGTISTIAYATGTWGNLITYSAPAPNMVLRSVSRVIPASSGVEAAFLWSQVDASAINTDFVADLSGDNGASWRTLSLTDTGNPVSGFQCLYGRLDGATGASLLWRARTFNSKRQKLRGVFWRPY